MELLYQGFDGLDLSFQAQISPEFSRELEAAKVHAQETHSPTVLSWNGLRIEVLESGARGGYAFTGSTGRYGATWFFKRPNARDPWGVRVSCASFNLALKGLGGARAELYATLDKLGIKATSESLGRIDYALDFLAPHFVLTPEHFVMHSQASRADRAELLSEMSVHGRSGRVTSVTVGKMPGRQVIVYDKRDEVIVKRKAGWWEIWNAQRARLGQEPLEPSNPNQSRIWRVELRAGKQHLKDRWNIRTWAELDARFGDLISTLIDAIRHTQPTGDSNRSRWPESDLWRNVREAALGDLFEMRNFVEPDLVKRVEKNAHDAMLYAQMIGILTTRAALHEVDVSELASFAEKVGRDMAHEIRTSLPRREKKLARAAGRYELGLDVTSQPPLSTRSGRERGKT